MQRFSGLFLLSLGLLFTTLGILAGGTIIFSHPQEGTGFAIVVFLPIVLVGAALIYAALRVMHGAKPFTAPKPAQPGEQAGNYLADVVEPREHRGQAYEVFYQAPVHGKNGRPSSLIVRVSATTPTTLQFCEENWFDRMCKHIGIAREHQTKDTIFDEAVYVRGPSSEYAKQYLEDDQKRTVVRTLLKQGFREVRLTGTSIEAVWPGFDPTANDRPGLTEETADKLFVLTRDLPEAEAGPVLAPPDHRAFWEKALWLAALAYAAVILFVFAYTPVRWTPLLLAGLAVFIPTYLLFGWIAAFLLRGTSTSHDRWGRLMGLGGAADRPGQCWSGGSGEWVSR